MEFECSNLSVWKEALSSYPSRIESLSKPNLVSLDDFYRNQLPSLLSRRSPNPHLTTAGNSHVASGASDLLKHCVQELSAEGETFTPSDVERALWSCAIGAKLLAKQSDPDPKVADKTKALKKKRKR